MVEDKITRATAIKTAIIELNRGEFVQEKEQNPNYLKMLDSRIVYRINVLGIIANKDKVGSMTNMLLDDGTGQITLRFFEENVTLDKLNLEDVILVIGKVRIFNEEKYISAEIVKKTSPEWLKVRLAELKNQIENLASIPITPEKKKLSSNKDNQNTDELFEEEVIDELEDEIKIKSNPLLPMEKVLLLIKELDKGDGALIEDVLERAMVDEPERILEKMLEKGDIFQNQPGKVKVL
ncbi:MAG: OB-fold nucleic acid binding domain-containing protein [archaeon]|nr:OB-fold nucleic acid binding domain-containing protein [archaeon]